MRAIICMIKKEFIQIRRDRRMFFMSFLSPVIQLVVLGYAANLDVTSLPLVVCDQDLSATSRDFIRHFTSSGTFQIVGWIGSTNDIDRFIDGDRVSMALVVPHGFESDVHARRPVPIQVIADGTNSNSAGIGLGYASLIVGQYSRDLVVQSFTARVGGGLRPGLSLASLDPRIRVWYNPTLRSRNYMVPAVVAMVLLLMTMLFTSLAVVREKEVGTMEQLIVTPIRPYQLLIGKLVPFMVLSLVDVLLVLLVAAFWFHVPLKGNVFLLFGLCFVFEIATLGLGLLISTISKTQQQATMVSQFFVMQPMMQLSGFAFPIENMPKVIQLVTYAMPLRYFMSIVRGIFLKGVGLHALGRDSLFLLVLGLVILTFAVFRFRKKLG